MDAFVVTAALYCFWVLLGSSTLELLRLPFRPLTGLLLTPVLGLTVLVLLVFSLNRVGLPVSRFANPLLTVLLLVSFVCLAVRTRRMLGANSTFPTRELLPALLVFIALGMSAWPFLLYGADWLSFANNDMANYSLLARRFIDHGFFEVPAKEELFSRKHYEQTYWLQGLVERPGAELILAWSAVVVRMAPTKSFMPLIISFHLAIVSATGALVSQVTSCRRAAILSMLFLSFAPLLTFGALYQLLGQTAGLGILLGASTSVALFGADLEPRTLARASLLLSLFLCAQLVVYPELFPFLICATILFFVVHALHPRSLPSVSSIVPVILPPLLLLPIVLRRYLLAALVFMAHQAHSGATGYKQAADVFQQYLLPSGIGGLWGFFNIYAQVPEPYLSIGIIAGAVLLMALGLDAVRAVRQREFLGAMFAVMISVAALLRWQASAFGLYKMAMYLQPFLWASLAVLLSRLRVPSWMIAGCAVPLLAVAARTQFDYVASSRGEADRTNGTFCEIYKGSSTRILTELENLAIRLEGQSVVSDSSNLVLAKLLSSAFIGIHVSLPFFDLFPTKSQQLDMPQAPELNAAQLQLHEAEAGRVSTVSFDMKEEGREVKSALWVENNSQPEDGAPGPFTLLINTALQTPFNRRLYGNSSTNFQAMPWEQVRNHLIFVDSTLGRLYYSHDRDRIALYQLEPDYFYPGKTMAGAGRTFVFQVVHPSPMVRLQLWLTASLKHDSNNLLPPAEAIGAVRRPFQIAGRGSARVFSPPLEPQKVLERFYLGLDMGADGVRWKEQRSGILKMFPTDIQADPRKLTGFLRDLSIVSEEEYQQRRSPSSLEHFPSDLTDPNLEYSGIYEDGWLSEESYAALDAPSQTAPPILHLQGAIPANLPELQGQQLRIRVDGETRFEGPLTAGNFQITLPLPAGTARRVIALTFQRVQALPGEDMRPVGAQLQRLSLESGAS